MPIQRILVATDFSLASERAIVRAGLIARAVGAALECVHVVPDTWLTELRAWLGGPGTDVSASIAAIEVRLRDFVARDLQRFDSKASTVVVVGSPAEVIAERAAAGAADLVVIGAHGRNFLRELFLGSTAIRVLSRSAVPVLIVRRAPEHPYGSVVVGTDFSIASAAAARLAAQVAPRGRVTLLHAYEDPYGADYVLERAQPEAVERYRALAYARAERAMRAFSADLGAAAATWRCELRHGPPALKLIEAAESGVTDLVVVGMRRREPLEALLVGRVSSHVVAESPCDVLTLREH
ncbi:MAG: universal stress protein [Burkholderiales bacterium]|jgi:nucleotide-binding universal stress UspA family protein|nr:universal stress protein [Burkholderiales bacterium]